MTFRKSKPDSSAEGGFTCETCKKSFPSHRGLQRHVTRNHQGTRFQCYHCSFSSKFKECLSRHVQLHLLNKVVNRNQGAYVKCPLCEFGTVVRETMIQHYADSHDVAMNEQHIEFPSMEEFLKWKYQIEQTDVCQYTSRSKKNRGAAQIRYYRCFRDGIFQKKGRGIRNMKLKGSLKINGICPAGMTVKEDRATGVVNVTVIRDHVGHSHELGLLTLSKIERAEIARKLAMGMSHEDIIGSIRGSMDANIKRLHLTTRKDLWNVQSSYGLHKTKAKKRVKTDKPANAIPAVEPTSHNPNKLETVPIESSVVETEVENVQYVLPNQPETTFEHEQQQHCARIETNDAQSWSVSCWVEPQGTSYYTAQAVSEEGNLTQNSYGVDSGKNTLVQLERATVEACESSNDNDGHYFEVVTPDPEPLDERLVPLESQLNEKKIGIQRKVDEILDMLKTEEQADLFYSELLRISREMLSQTSYPGHF